jgi:phage terminase small subunit
MKMLSVTEILFVNHYMEHRNAVDALLAASDKYVGWKEKAQLEEANKLLARTHVAEEIERRAAVHARAASITQSEVVDELRKVAMFDMRKLFGEDGNLIPIHELDEETARGLSHFEIVQLGEGGTILKSVPANKLKALELLGKHLKMYTDKVEQTNVGPSVSVNIDWIRAEDAPPASAGEGGDK